jgi:hypothetical protein
MDFWFDVIDWVGGYRYEDATADDVKNWLSKRDSDRVFINYPTADRM